MKSYGLGPAVNPLAVACPKCRRAAGKPCARRAASKDVDPMAGVFLRDWIGAAILLPLGARDGCDKREGEQVSVHDNLFTAADDHDMQRKALSAKASRVFWKAFEDGLPLLGADQKANEWLNAKWRSTTRRWLRP